MNKLTPSQVIDIHNKIAHVKDVIEYYQQHKPSEYLAIHSMYQELDMLRTKLEDNDFEA